MAKRNEKEEKIYQMLTAAVQECGVELIDVKWLKENGKIFLRLFIDKRGGVSLDDCEAVNNKVDPMLDKAGETGHDFLEVQSPGLDRPLSELRDFLLHMDEEVEVKLYQKKEDKKVYQGILNEADESGFSILDEQEESHRFSFEEVANVKRVIRFD